MPRHQPPAALPPSWHRHRGKTRRLRQKPPCKTRWLSSLFAPTEMAQWKFWDFRGRCSWRPVKVQCPFQSLRPADFHLVAEGGLGGGNVGERRMDVANAWRFEARFQGLTGEPVQILHQLQQ